MQSKVLVGTTAGLYDLRRNRNVQLEEHEVTYLATQASGLWAIVDGKEVWHCRSNEDWQRCVSTDALQVNCLSVTSTGILVGTSEAQLFRIRDENLEPVHPFQKAEGRDTWYTPWGGPPDVRSMTQDGHGRDYVNVHVGGVLRLGNDGTSWHSTIDLHADVHQVLWDPGSGLLLAATGQGLGVSADEGRSWEFHTDGLHGHYLRAVAVAEETVLVTASTGPFSRHAAVYRRARTGGGRFERCESGLPKRFSKNIDTFCLAAWGPEVAFGTSDGKVFSSSDQGRSWTVAAEELPAVRCVTFV